MAKDTIEKRRSPLSERTWWLLNDLQDNYGWTGRLFRSARYRREVLKIHRQNIGDLHRARKLSAALWSLTQKGADAISFSIANETIGGNWRPFRVERGLTGSMRGEVCGGRLTGQLTSDMLDSSSVLFLENDAGETMRVLLPSPATSWEMLKQSLERWRKEAGYLEQPWGWGVREQDTHTSLVIHNFVRSDTWTMGGLAHPETIDMIDTSCQKPEEVRPTIRVQGSLIQKGVTLAAAIVVNGQQRIFVPTGFFKALTGAVQTVLPSAQAPRLLVT